MMNKMLKLPTPSSITYMWNYGSILGLSLAIQIATGIFLSLHYSSTLTVAFDSVVHINFDVNNGYFIRLLHANGATMFFVCLYLHVSRGIWFKSYNSSFMTWISGVSMFLLFMSVAFLGYVLPWGQMSYWGATVITNLISAVPYVGKSLVEWIWGGFSVSGPTLSRFYTFHFVFPLIGTMLVFSHLMFLHESGSSNPLGLMYNTDKVSFHPYFTIKDMMGFYFMLLSLAYIIFHMPMLFMDSDNFIEANSLVTPVHIQPEWYFLFAYAILRSIPNKLGGVVGLLMSIIILYLMPFLVKEKYYYKGIKYHLFCSIFFLSFSMLTLLGAMPVESPFSEMSMWTSLMYFISFMLMCM